MPRESKSRLSSSVMVALSTLLQLLLALNFLQVPYPNVYRNATVVDDYFGVQVADPYRWLEDLNSPETQAFVEAQTNLTNQFLATVTIRPELRQRVREVWNFHRSSVPQKVGSQYFTLENDGLQNHSVLYMRNGLYGKGRVFFNPEVLSADGSVTLESFAFSGEGRIIAFVVQEKGSDWRTIRFRDARTGKELKNDVLRYSKGVGVVWAPDNSGVFYTRFPWSPTTRSGRAEVDEHEKLYYHRIGTRQAQDILVAEFPDSPSLRMSVQISQDLNYLIIRTLETFHANGIFLIPLWHGIDNKLKQRIVQIFPSSTDDLYEYIGNDGPMFLFRTSRGAPNYRVIQVKINAEKAGRSIIDYWTTIIQEDPNRVLDWAVPVTSDTMLLRYIDGLQHKVELRNTRHGRPLYRFNFQPGSMTDYSVGYIDGNTLEFFVQMESFLNPGTMYRCLLNGYYVGCDVFRQERTVIDTRGYVVQLVTARSRDGTKVPLHIVRKRDAPLNGSAPALLYGYGGFNVALLPRFSITNLMFMEHFGGVYAQAVIRGGGEFGTNWYKQGALLEKQNSFDDFQAAAEYLIGQNYTSAAKLTIQGGSHGGLLVGACVNQRPELFAAAIAQSGVMDLLRFQKFTSGHIWCREYGCSDKEEYFRNLITYSPLHNIRVPPNESEVQYPAMLVMTADHDDRVVPSHSYKYVAELQYTIGLNSNQTKPLLLRVDKDAGHSNEKSLHKLIDDVTDVLSFISQVLGLAFRRSSDTGNGHQPQSTVPTRRYQNQIPVIPNPGPIFPGYFLFPSYYSR